MNALSDLLGEEKLERFQAFEMNQTGRYWVGQLSARLAPADKLQPDQGGSADRAQAGTVPDALRCGLDRGGRSGIPVVSRSRSKTCSEMRNDRHSSRMRIPGASGRSRIGRWSRRLRRSSRPCSWRSSPSITRRSRTTSGVTSRSARAEAGMDPKIPEKPEVVEETPKLIEAQVQVKVSLTVNREPTTVTRTVRNGESFTFEAAHGLIAEATPMMC